MYNRPHSIRNLNARESERDPLIGTWIGNYELISQIGQGGMGIVYLAQHPVLRKKVAIKVLREEVARHAEVVHRFRTEARAISQISHPNVVEVTDFGETQGGLLYFVMEHLEGRALGEILQQERGPFSLPRGVYILAQIARGLSAAHAQGVIHRDLKPDNIFLLPQAQPLPPETVKILDFGIAKLADLSGGREGPIRKTDRGTVLGTPAYMSPEQAGGEEIDARSDLYSLGIIAYEMFVGDVPFKADTLGRLIYKHVHELPVPPKKKNREISQPLEEIILRCLEKRVERRPASAADVARTLEGLLVENEEAKTNVQISIADANHSPPFSALHPSTTRSAPLGAGAFFEEDDTSRQEDRGEPTRIASSSRQNEHPQTKLSRPVPPKESSRLWIAPTKPPIQEDDDTTSIASSNQKEILERLEQFRAKSPYAMSSSEPLSSPAIMPIPPLTWEDTSMESSQLAGRGSSFLAAIPAGLGESGSWEDTSIREDSDPGWAQIPTRIAQVSSAQDQVEQKNPLSHLNPAQLAALEDLTGEKTLPPRDMPPPLEPRRPPHDDLTSASWDAIPTSIAQLPQDLSSSPAHEPPLEAAKTAPEAPFESFRSRAIADRARPKPSPAADPPTRVRIESDSPTNLPTRVPQPSPTAILEEAQIPDRHMPPRRSARMNEAPAATEAPVWVPPPRAQVQKTQSPTQPDVDLLPSMSAPLRVSTPAKEAPAASPGPKQRPAASAEPPAKEVPEKRASPPRVEAPSPQKPAVKPGLDSRLDPGASMPDPVPSISLSVVKSIQTAPAKVVDNATKAVRARNKLILFALLAGALLAALIVVLVVPLLKETDDASSKVLPQIVPSRSVPQTKVLDPPASSKIPASVAVAPPAPEVKEIPVYVDSNRRCAEDFEIFAANEAEALGISTVTQPLLIKLTAPSYTFKKGGYTPQEKTSKELEQKKPVCLEVIETLLPLDAATLPEDTEPEDPEPKKTVKKTPAKKKNIRKKNNNRRKPKDNPKPPPKKNKFSLD